MTGLTGTQAKTPSVVAIVFTLGTGAVPIDPLNLETFFISTLYTDNR